MTELISATVRRRRHGSSLKAQILAECERPGGSIAAVAMAHGVNANLVHKWRARAAKRQDTAVTAPNISFVPVPLQAAAMTQDGMTERLLGTVVIDYLSFACSSLGAAPLLSFPLQLFVMPYRSSKRSGNMKAAQK